MFNVLPKIVSSGNFLMACVQYSFEKQADVFKYHLQSLTSELVLFLKVLSLNFSWEAAFIVDARVLE